jgi:hypothetical protein
MKGKKAVNGKNQSRLAYEGLTASIDENLILGWMLDEEKAMKERGDSLKIYQVQENTGGRHALHRYAQLTVMSSCDSERCSPYSNNGRGCCWTCCRVDFVADNRVIYRRCSVRVHFPMY